jgi:uncharacterized protein (TIGR01732 family)
LFLYRLLDKRTGKEENELFGYGYGGYGGCCGYGYGGWGYGCGFVLIVVLFILLIIVGATVWY